MPLFVYRSAVIHSIDKGRPPDLSVEFRPSLNGSDSQNVNWWTV